MKTEEIAEKAMELFPNYDYCESISQTDEWAGNEIQQLKRDFYVHGYKDGKAEANAEWQEKTRWIPVEEKLPPYYHPVLCKTESYTFIGWRASDGEESFYTVYCSDTIIHQEVTHWREIIE